MTQPFTYTAPVRFLEVDQQGVVFNMWYLGYLDEAFGAFIGRGGTSYREIIGTGIDLQVVHTEIDWRGSLGSGDTAHVEVALARLGRTSVTIQFSVHAGDAAQPVAEATTVYVVVSTADWSKQEPTPLLLEALGPVAPLRDS